MVEEKKDMVSILAGVSRKGRREFYRQNKKGLKMTWEQFKSVVEKKRVELYGR